MKEYRLHGPPGCGKSHALATSWVPKAADRFGADNVVVCSLTKTAAAEIASRLTLKKDNVGTLHALAYRALGRPSIAESETPDWNSRFPMYRLTGGRSSPLDEPEAVNERGTVGDEMMSRAQIYRHTLTPLADWRDDVRAFHKKWKEWMRDNDLIDFTGLIEQALEFVPSAPGSPSVFVVDEAQDCSALELALVRRWAEAAEYAVLAGDGDQAIYGWRGASARAFLDAPIPEDHNYHLTQSYRVPRAVHATATEWIKQAKDRYAVEYKPRDEEGEVSTSAGSGRNVEPIINAIKDDVRQGSSVMLLATCGFMLNAALASLRREGVPFHNAYRPSNGAWNPLRGGSRRLAAFLRPDSSVYGKEARNWTWAEAAAWTDLLSAKRALAAGGKTIIQRMAKDAETADNQITNVEGRACFGDSWDYLKLAFDNDGALNWLRDNLLPSKVKIMQYPLSIAQKEGPTSLLQDPKLTVGTVHSVKGGQADSVYLLPDLSRSGAREWIGRGEGREGLIRTVYVGMTRARQKLVLCRRWSPASLDWAVRA